MSQNVRLRVTVYTRGTKRNSFRIPIDAGSGIKSARKEIDKIWQKLRAKTLHGNIQRLWNEQVRPTAALQRAGRKVGE